MPPNKVPVESKSTTVRLFIAEEQQLLREAYQTFLDESLGIRVVGTASDCDGPRLTTAAAALHPHVILIGASSVTRALVNSLGSLRRRSPETSLVFLGFAFEPAAVGALQSYARRTGTGLACFRKQTASTASMIADAVHRAADGDSIVDPTVAEDLLVSGGPLGALGDLSMREIEVLRWLARGYRNGAVAEALHLDPKTVERHVSNIYRKLGPCPEGMHPRVRAVAALFNASWAESWDRPAGLGQDQLGDVPAQDAEEQRDRGEQEFGRDQPSDGDWASDLEHEEAHGTIHQVVEHRV